MGCAYLKCLAKERFETSPAGVIVLEEGEIAAGLRRVGLSADAARIFLRHATLGTDEPRHVRLSFGEDRQRQADPVRAGTAGHQYRERRAVQSRQIPRAVVAEGNGIRSGRARILRQEGHGLPRLQGEARRRGVRIRRVLVWGGYVFLFECKNRSLSGFDPVQAYYFGLENRSNAGQVLRLTDALERYPDILTEQFGPEAAGKKIVPCVLNSMPFSLPGMQDGVYFTDWSVIGASSRRDMST
jgi:hypothetical protein